MNAGVEAERVLGEVVQGKVHISILHAAEICCLPPPCMNLTIYRVAFLPTLSCSSHHLAHTYRTRSIFVQYVPCVLMLLSSCWASVVVLKGSRQDAEWLYLLPISVVSLQNVPSQPLVRYYGGNTVVDATGPAATDLQSATQLSKDILTQYSNNTAAGSPLRVLGLFASSCFACRTTQLCGTLSCALGVSGKGRGEWGC